MDKKLKRLLQEDMQKEADHISKMLDNRPEEEKEDLPASDYMEVLVSLQKFAETEAKLEEERKAQAEKTKASDETKNSPEEAQSRLSSEEQELIRLGGVYKKRRKWNRLAILVAALVCVLSLGLTATGGPDKLFQEVKRMMSGREQTRVNTDSDRIQPVEGVSEEDAYQKIEDAFDVYPVRMNYLPQGMNFVEFVFYDDTQSAQFIYEAKTGEMMTYTICPNYRVSSIGKDVEDAVIQEYDIETSGALVHITQYQINGTNRKRWFAEFECQDVHYILRMVSMEEEEMEKIVENLFFS